MTSTVAPVAATAPPYPAVWLRDNCPCPVCRDPLSGQKLFDITDLPRELAIGDFFADGCRTAVTFEPDGHHSVFSTMWLEAQFLEVGHDHRNELTKQLWSARDVAGAMPRYDWLAYVVDRDVRLRTLRSVERLGFALLRGTPTGPGTVLEVARTFGYVRETNYGELFDVRVSAGANNLAFTNRAIGPHTDNPYRDPAPTLQLLHCLKNAATGGETLLVDGFLAAALLRERAPEAFDVLTETPVRFSWRDEHASLSAVAPIIEVDVAGAIRGIRFNNRSMGTLRGDPLAITRFYDAYRAFGEILRLDALALRTTLAPGDCIIFDNTRVLHARTAFATAGASIERHLQGCYADIDGLLSSIAILEDHG